MTTNKTQVKTGDRFMAIIKKGIYSKTLLGKEEAGKIIGPFVATYTNELCVETDTMHFKRNFWDFNLL